MTPHVVQDDGSILFDAPVSFASANYSPDPDNPRRYIPKYDPCSKRVLELKVLPCGKKFADWRCSLYNQGVSVAFCRNCGVPANEKR